MPEVNGVSAANCYVTLNGVDISGAANMVQITPKLDVESYRVFAQDSTRKTAGKYDWSGKIRVIYAEGAAEGSDTAWNAWAGKVPVALVVAPKGNTAGNWKWTGNVIVSEAPLQFDGESAKAIFIEFAIEGDGDLTKGTV
jgi:hypothetical protein